MVLTLMLRASALASIMICMSNGDGPCPLQVRRELNSASVLSYCAYKKTLKLSFLMQIISKLIKDLNRFVLFQFLEIEYPFLCEPLPTIVS